MSATDEAVGSVMGHSVKRTFPRPDELVYKCVDCGLTGETVMDFEMHGCQTE